MHKFIRVYDHSDHKTGYGKVISITDQSIIIQRHGERIEYPYSSFYKIKTGRSAGYRIGVSSLAFGALGLVTGALSFEENSFFTRGDTIIFFGLAGFLVGGVVALASLPFKRSKTFYAKDFRPHMESISINNNPPDITPVLNQNAFTTGMISTEINLEN
ncbi:hypothetical protein E7Z59_05815 [Robertkochia marina]|uniref:Uncharacterized protein n=1 Tax=Robertkochia marina TaxID=1227945 RepID=A0A4S3M3S8_9FLAO|nr:hypothetical protein [Robertkochia marina]THD69842.1 hypothetical protein E7Z59_05815 [Robertkochia marina]TRZ46813.1 hypothetical protein D3A96_04395 [Robertkochia marina]